MPGEPLRNLVQPVALARIERLRPRAWDLSLTEPHSAPTAPRSPIATLLP
jgi:hypothetical protein